jgi:nitrile hydratase accessory protein
LNRHDPPPGVDAPVFAEQVFAEPWQAAAFALTVALHGKGLFSWSEWAEALSSEVKRPDAAADGSDYYDHWLAALEKLLASKGVAATPEVDAAAAAWERAAHATPHGKPILLENDPQRQP